MNLLNRVAMIVWHRGKAKLKHLCRNEPTETQPTHGTIYHLPFEIIEMIIAHPTLDIDTLKACSLTCRSWYTTTVPHIHHTLVLKGGIFYTGRQGLSSLPGLHRLGLIPLVKEIRVGQYSTGGWFRPGAFNSCQLSRFSTFTNVHTMIFQGLEIYRFVPGIERYFQQFSSSLRSISLYYPTCGAPQYLWHFLSLFSNLEKLHIRYLSTYTSRTHNAELVPLSAPISRGRSTLHRFPSTEAWTHLIYFCGIRLHHVVLRNVGARAIILLGTCTKTLGTLRCYLMEDTGQ